MAQTRKRKAPQVPVVERPPTLLMELDPKAIQWPHVRITSHFRDGQEEALARSLELMGQEQAIRVVKEGDDYYGTDGKHRCEEAIRLGNRTIRCEVTDGSFKRALFSNIVTATLHGEARPSEEIDLLDYLFSDAVGVSLEELAQETGYSLERAKMLLAIAKASSAVRQGLEDGWITLGHAHALARIEDRKVQEAMYHRLLMKGRQWTVPVLELEIRKAMADGGVHEDGHGAPPRSEAGTTATCAFCEEVQDAQQLRILPVCFHCAGLIVRGKIVRGKDAEKAEAEDKGQEV